MHLGSGLSVGLAGLAAGYTIGIVGDAVRLPKPFLGHYGLTILFRGSGHICSSHEYTLE
jgi:hypothetical protein